MSTAINGPNKWLQPHPAPERFLLVEKACLVACKIFSGIFAIATIGSVAIAVIAAAPVFIALAILCAIGGVVCVKRMERIEDDADLRSQALGLPFSERLQCFHTEELIRYKALDKADFEAWLDQNPSWDELPRLSLSAVQNHPNIFNADKLRAALLAKGQNLSPAAWQRMNPVVNWLQTSNEPAWQKLRNTLLNHQQEKCRAYICQNIGYVGFSITT